MPSLRAPVRRARRSARPPIPLPASWCVCPHRLGGLLLHPPWSGGKRRHNARIWLLLWGNDGISAEFECRMYSNPELWLSTRRINRPLEFVKRAGSRGGPMPGSQCPQASMVSSFLAVARREGAMNSVETELSSQSLDIRPKQSSRWISTFLFGDACRCPGNLPSGRSPNSTGMA